MSAKSDRKELVATYCRSNSPEGYDETAKRVNKSYAETKDIHWTMRETRLPFDVVREMVGFRDWMGIRPQPSIRASIFPYEKTDRNYLPDPCCASGMCGGE